MRHSFELPGGLAPPCRVISSGRKSLYETSYSFDGGIFCQDGCPVQCNNSIRSLKETPFSRSTNVDKLTTKQLGLPRPNVSIQQVSTKGGKSYIQELERKKIAVVKWLTRSVFHIPLSLFIGFTVSQFASCTDTESFFMMTYFAFVSRYFQDQSINIVGFDL